MGSAHPAEKPGGGGFGSSNSREPLLPPPLPRKEAQMFDVIGNKHTSGSSIWACAIAS